MELSLGDRVCLFLDERERTDGSTSPVAHSPTTISDGLGIDTDSIRDRLGLFETIDELQAADFLAEGGEPTGADVDRNRYTLTEAGRRRASSLRQSLLAESVTDAETDEERPLGELLAAADEESLVALLGRVSDEGVLHPARRSPDTDFVDRPDARSTLQEAVETLPERGGRTILLAGEAGVGKSALVDELLESLADELAVGRAACRRGTDEPYGPVRRALTHALDDGAASIFVGPDGGGVDEADAVEARRTALFSAVSTAVCERSGDRPICLFIDDLQWADESTLALLERLADEIASWISPVLLVGAYRPAAVSRPPLATVREQLAAGDRFDEIELRPFDRRMTATFVRRLTGDPDPPATFVDLVQEVTGGNPLIVRAAVTAMIDDGDVDPAAGVYPERLDDVDVPAAARRAVERRLGSLDEVGRRVVEAAAVVGRTVRYPLLASVVEIADPDLRDYVDLLVDAGVLERTDTARLQFTSALVRETVLAAVPEDRARRLHGRTADRLAETGGTEATIAGHYERADRPAAAIDYYVRAAERAQAAYAQQTAIDAYQRALALADDAGDDRATSIQIELGTVRFVRGEYDVAVERFESALDRTGEAAIACRASHRLAEIRVKRGDVEDGLDAVERGLTLASPAVRAIDRCRLHRVKGWARLQGDDLAGARAAFERQREVAQASDDPLLRGLAAHDLGTLAGKTGELDRAETLLTEAESALERAEANHHLSKTLTNLALVHRYGGALDQAIEANDRALDLQHEYGFHETLPSSLMNQALLYVARGDLERAIERYEAAIDAATEIGREERAAMARVRLAGVALRMGDLDRAASATETALETFERLSSHDGLVVAVATRAEYRLLAGDLATARADGERALEIARELGNADRTAETLGVLGTVRRAQGEPEAALDHHREAVSLLTEGGNEVVTTELGLEVVADLLAVGWPERARTAAEEAVDDAERIGERLLAARARTLLAESYQATGRDERARELLRTAADVQRRCGASVDRCRTELALSALALDAENESAADHITTAATVVDDGVELFSDRLDRLAARERQRR